jgi:Ni,Fe-hydrogenase III large subunit
MDLEGETITNIDYHSGMNERGCADRISRIPLSQALTLVPRVCGTCGHAHMMAFCQAIETLTNTTVPIRAQFIRMIVVELERMSMNLAGAANLCSVIGVEQYAKSLRTLQQSSNSLSLELITSRSAPNIITPGGVAYNPPGHAFALIQTGITQLIKQLYALIDMIIDNRNLLARTIEIGTLANNAVAQLEVGGIIARASGITRDLRFDIPYAAYHRLDVNRVVQAGGDVYARLIVMLLESHESAKVVEQSQRLLKAVPMRRRHAIVDYGDCQWECRSPTWIINLHHQ